MVSPKSYKSIIPLSFLLISVLVQSIPGAYADFVSDTCQKTSNPQVCESILRPDSRSVQVTTIKDLAKISFDISILSALAASRQASDLERQNRGNPLQRPLGECEQIYLNMMSDLHTGEAALKQEIYGRANDLASQAQQAPIRCETEFSKKNIPSLLTNTNYWLQNKAGVCMALTKLLIPGLLDLNSRKTSTGF